MIVEKAREWLKKAETDLKVASILIREGIYDYSLFHSQQAVEKYLKAFLTYHNKPFGKTHNIPLLLSLCAEIDQRFEDLLKLDFSILFPLGVTIRYPIGREITEDEAKEAME
ncbi:HEPN domain-containing protein [Archaeoglobus neptunius]|uniref:HEPN domain-containing protein n=1 Tax=Archaeoglobus neptunius TaxID=2798580 RepID=UPI0019257D85|nr:HEPN domain-containing protein [Archaeoglobus neptunius]